MTPKVRLGDLQGRCYFHDNTRTVFAFSFLFPHEHSISQSLCDSDNFDS